MSKPTTNQKRREIAEMSVTTADGEMPLIVAAPDGPPEAAVIVLQEAFGLNTYIHGVVGELAAAGYLAVAPAIFYRTTTDVIPYGDHSLIMPHIEALSDPELQSDMDAVTAYLGAEGFTPDKIGAVGFCIGGRVSFLLAAQRRLGASVTFYGGGIVTAAPAFEARLPSLLPVAGSLQTPWLGIFGDQDRSISVDDVVRLQEAVEASTVDTEIVRFAEAGHAFHCTDRPEFDEAAAAEGWGRTMEWLQRHLIATDAAV